MEREIPVKKELYHKAMLMVLNFELGLSNMEIDMVSILLNNNITIVDTEAREIIRKALNKDKFITNNYIQRLKNKNIFVVRPADKNLYLNPELLAIVKQGEISFKFKIS